MSSGVRSTLLTSLLGFDVPLLAEEREEGRSCRACLTSIRAGISCIHALIRMVT